VHLFITDEMLLKYFSDWFCTETYLDQMVLFIKIRCMQLNVKLDSS